MLDINPYSPSQHQHIHTHSANKLSVHCSLFNQSVGQQEFGTGFNCPFESEDWFLIGTQRQMAGILQKSTLLIDRNITNQIEYACVN